MIESSLALNEGSFIQSLNRASSALEHFKLRIVNLAQSFDLLHTGVEVFDKIRDALDFSAQMEELHLQTGASAGEMAVLSHAFENAGMGADGASSFVSRLQKALSGLNEDGSETSAAFRRLGIDMVSLRRLPLLDQVNALQSAFQRLGNVNDRTKLAMDIFGRSGAQDVRFLVNPKGISEAREQVGGLKDLLDRNAEVFCNLADALDSLKLKVTQFFAGFAEGLAGDTARFTEWLNKLDLTSFGEQAGRFSAKIAGMFAAFRPVVQVIWEFVSALKYLAPPLEFIATHFKTILPLLELLALRMAIGRFAASNFGAAMIMNFSQPLTALQGLIIKLGGFKEAMAAIKFAAFEANIGELTTAIGALNVAMLAVAAAWAGWQAGKWIREQVTHENETIAASQERGSVLDEGEKDREDILGRKMESKQDQASTLKDLDTMIAGFRKQMADAAGKYSGERLADVDNTISQVLAPLQRIRGALSKVANLPDANAPAYHDLTEVPGSVPVSKLGRIGGAMNGIGFMGGGSDPHLNKLEQIHQTLKGLLTAVTGSPTASRPPVYHST